MDARAPLQHIDDIEIPLIEITAGWPADSVKTPEDCNDALSYLMSAVAQIEFQIEMEMNKPKSSWDTTWLAKARCALKYKKAALQIVGHRRGAINDAERRALHEARDRRLLEYIRSVVPNETFLTWLHASGVTTMDLEATP